MSKPSNRSPSTGSARPWKCACVRGAPPADWHEKTRAAHRHQRLRPGHDFSAAPWDKLYDRRLSDVAIRQNVIYELLRTIARHNEIYKRAGAVHGCALCAGAEVLTFVEDVGRHNAADAIAGMMWLEGMGRRRQDLLHHRAADVGDRDEDRAHGHTGAAVALRHHPSGA